MNIFAIIGFFPFSFDSLGEGKSLLFSSVELKVIKMWLRHHQANYLRMAEYLY